MPVQAPDLIQDTGTLFMIPDGTLESTKESKEGITIQTWAFLYYIYALLVPRTRARPALYVNMWGPLSSPGLRRYAFYRYSVGYMCV